MADTRANDDHGGSAPRAGGLSEGMPDGGSGRSAGRTPASPGALLALGALGIVYGDIGTSPLYALRESFRGEGHELPVTEANVLGVLSLVLWSLVVVITIKYLVVVMRADNDGEGGILALTSLVRTDRPGRRRRRALVLLGLFGTALLYGDGMITPAISVLSAIEGTAIVAPAVADLSIPISVVILVALFSVQRRGTGAVGRVFGPVMLVWFAVLAVLGLTHIVTDPGVLAAVNPLYGVRFLVDNGVAAFLSLGSVFLVVTGGEALYADMGHFGRRPIALGWTVVVLPGLVLNYFGQGALLLAQPDAIDNPFYRLAPDWAGVPLVVLATLATVIASQALISGAFSLTMQAVQLGYLPRLRIVHTSAAEHGQVYVPTVNWVLLVAAVGLVVGFRSSTALAAAYGVAVTLTMVITTLVFALVALDRFGWSVRRVAVVCGALLVVDLGFFGANLPKVPHGGWFPLLVGGLVFTMLTTWATGRRLVRQRSRRGRTTLQEFVTSVLRHPPVRVPGTAVYLFGVPGAAPPPLLSNFRANHVFHERMLMVSVVVDRTPRVLRARRVRRQDLGHGIEAVELHYGFMEVPSVADDLQARAHVDPDDVVYFLGRELVVVGHADDHVMAAWRDHLFTIMRRNATSAADWFRLPPDRVIELSTRVEL